MPRVKNTKDGHIESQFRTRFVIQRSKGESFWGESEVRWCSSWWGMNRDEPQRQAVGEGGRENSSSMSGRPEQTVPSIDNAISRRSCFEPSWLIRQCHSGHSGIHPQYPRGNRVGIRMGPRTDRRPAQRLSHQTRRVGEKAWPWKLYIKPAALAISHHCLYTSRDSHPPPTHLSVCVWDFAGRWSFSGSRGRLVWKCVRTFLSTEQLLCLRCVKSALPLKNPSE